MQQLEEQLIVGVGELLLVDGVLLVPAQTVGADVRVHVISLLLGDAHTLTVEPVLAPVTAHIEPAQSQHTLTGLIDAVAGSRPNILYGQRNLQP